MHAYSRVGPSLKLCSNFPLVQVKKVIFLRVISGFDLEKTPTTFCMSTDTESSGE